MSNMLAARRAPTGPPSGSPTSCLAIRGAEMGENQRVQVGFGLILSPSQTPFTEGMAEPCHGRGWFSCPPEGNKKVIWGVTQAGSCLFADARGVGALGQALLASRPFPGPWLG